MSPAAKDTLETRVALNEAALKRMGKSMDRIDATVTEIALGRAGERGYMSGFQMGARVILVLGIGALAAAGFKGGTALWDMLW